MLAFAPFMTKTSRLFSFERRLALFEKRGDAFGEIRGPETGVLIYSLEIKRPGEI
jgi:hypothetical protein